MHERCFFTSDRREFIFKHTPDRYCNDNEREVILLKTMLGSFINSYRRGAATMADGCYQFISVIIQHGQILCIYGLKQNPHIQALGSQHVSNQSAMGRHNVEQLFIVCNVGWYIHIAKRAKRSSLSFATVVVGNRRICLWKWEGRFFTCFSHHYMFAYTYEYRLRVG